MSDPVDVCARTVWGEARSCGRAGMQRVANVICNRANHPRWWGKDISSVCLQPWQFSCRNADDPNLPKLLAVTDKDPEFAVALSVARQAVAGMLPDLTGGADSYYALSMPKPPSWITRAKHTVSDGWHSFWRVELLAPSGEPEAPLTGWVPANTGNYNGPNWRDDPLENTPPVRGAFTPNRSSAPAPNPDNSADDLNAEQLAKLRA